MPDSIPEPRRTSRHDGSALAVDEATQVHRPAGGSTRHIDRSVWTREEHLGGGEVVGGSAKLSRSATGRRSREATKWRSIHIRRLTATGFLAADHRHQLRKGGLRPL